MGSTERIPEEQALLDAVLYQESHREPRYPLPIAVEHIPDNIILGEE